MRPASERVRPPAPPITMRSPISAKRDEPMGSAGRSISTERLHQAEAGLLVEAERMTFHHMAVAEMQPDSGGFRDQVADGQHQPVVDQHAVAGALDPQRLGGKAVGRDD